MGYKGDALKSQFTENKIWERQAAAAVVVPQNLQAPRGYCCCKYALQEVFVTGGKHFISDKMFKATENNRQTLEAVEMENGKKSWVEYHLRRKAALPILECLVNELENNAGQQTRKELEMLLRWKGVPVSKMGNVANR
jgi:hypothetical protein